MACIRGSKKSRLERTLTPRTNENIFKHVCHAEYKGYQEGDLNLDDTVLLHGLKTVLRPHCQNANLIEGKALTKALLARDAEWDAAKGPASEPKTVVVAKGKAGKPGQQELAQLFLGDPSESLVCSSDSSSVLVTVSTSSESDSSSLVTSND